MMPFSLERVCVCRPWILTALPVDSSEARDLTHSSLLTNLFPYLHHFPTLFTLLINIFNALLSSFPFSLPFPSLVTSLLSSNPYALQLPALVTSLLLSLPYFLHTPTLFTSSLCSLPHSVHFPTFFISSLSDFSSFFMSVLFSLYSFQSSLPSSLHFPRLLLLYYVHFLTILIFPCLFTSLLFSCPHSLHFTTFFTSLLSSGSYSP